MNRADVVQLLINSHASLNLQNNNGLTAVDFSKLNTLTFLNIKPS